MKVQIPKICTKTLRHSEVLLSCGVRAVRKAYREASRWTLDRIVGEDGVRVGRHPSQREGHGM